MDITVCVCTRDRPGYLGDCLAGLLRQTVDPTQFDILVVDSASNSTAREAIRYVVDSVAHARLLRVDRPGVSLARNAGAAVADGRYIAYIDDDAIPAPDWIERILAALDENEPPPALIGGRILPQWEAPMPGWWPPQLRGTLSIIEFEGSGEYRSEALPRGLEPYGANMIVHAEALRAVGGFGGRSGRVGNMLLSDEDVQLAWRLQAAGFPVRYDSRIVVRHQIQASRLTPRWLLARLYWQGVSTVITRRLLGDAHTVWRELPRRLALTGFLAPLALVPTDSPAFVECRWRLAYAAGFVRAALGPRLASCE